MKLSSKALGTSITAAALLSLAFAPTSLAATATSWAPTATQALSLENATDLGPLSSTTPIHITLGLRLQNQSQLDQYIQAISSSTSPLCGQSLTPAEFVSKYGPSSSQVNAVTSYLNDCGFTNIQVSPNNLLVTASGTAAQVESAFNTKLEQYQLNGQIVYYNTTGAMVPAALANIVGSVLGVNDVVAAASPMQKPSPPSSSGSGSGSTVSLPNYPTSYNPQGFQKAYDVGRTPTGGKTNIAIFAEGDLSGVVKDLRTEEKANGLPQVPYSIIQTGIASSDTSGADEWDLDTQYSTGMAQNVNHLYIYDATSLTDSDIALEFNKFVTDDLAKAGSASFGEDESFPYLDGAMLVDDEIFAEAAAQGQTVFASSGDTGGFSTVTPTNGVPAGIPDVEYPAASPYVVAVGGTTLITNSDGSYNEELAWLAGGGGQSYWESAPYWQNGVVPTSTVGKGVPDIAMDADPNSGANVYINGTPTVVGGTSLASPLALGVWARLESSHGNHLGFAAPLLYAQYGTAGFHDITLGDNGPYPATPGWDFATGLGSFDVSQMNNLIGK
ncbi:S53 family peptidase [Alicyclobacillus ferrooxydans]|uniref:S53 family peptidase n=1 Tax=Alicyclobacillus ferrooxydans TaxID=471514 RepID=UPI0006D53BD2|nr:S53 family peptidase [Alicyclobacillus ferrooxydans]